MLVGILSSATAVASGVGSSGHFNLPSTPIDKTSKMSRQIPLSWKKVIFAGTNMAGKTTIWRSMAGEARPATDPYVRTTGIVSRDIDLGDVRWSLCDLGGTRNERGKWIHAFDGTDVVVYVINLVDW